MASKRPRKRRASDDELVKALLETTNVGEVANRVGLHQSSVRRRLRSAQFQARLEAARGALKVNAREQVVDPGNSRSIEAHWKGQAERYSAQIQRELVVKSQRRKTGQERPHRWFIPVVGFTVRLVWAAFHLILFLAVISLLALIVLFVRYATVP